jgi:hypothetical protein
MRVLEWIISQPERPDVTRVMKLTYHERSILPSTYKLQPFFRITAFHASLSRLQFDESV